MNPEFQPRDIASDNVASTRSQRELKAQLRNLPIRRLLTASQAAAYLGYETAGLLKNLPVRPIRLAEVGPGSAPRYDVRALDRFLDRLSGLEAASVPANDDNSDVAQTALEEWKANRAAR